jgi:hypothetical protein
MQQPPGREPRDGVVMTVGRWLARYRLLVLAVVAYVIFAPAALIALPLAALLVLTSLRSPRELVTAAIAGGLSLAWLMDSGGLPDQAVRASAIIATTVYVTVSWLVRTSVIHRCLIATAGAAVSVAALLVALGSSWGELQWWVEHQVGYAARVASQVLWMVGNGSASTAASIDTWISDSVRFMADYFPAIGTIQLIAGLSLATALYHAVAHEPHGPGLKRLRDFRFSEHLGWAAIAGLAVILIPKLAAAKLAAVNLLLVMGMLYALRGVAVAAFGIQLLGAGSGMFTALAMVAALLMLPIALAGAILLGVVDSGLDLRRRWTTPRAS